MQGTGLVVWAVCGPPVPGSIICSALPWSAMITAAPPTASSAASMAPTITMAEMALVTAISGVCSAGVTDQTT